MSHFTVGIVEDIGSDELLLLSMSARDKQVSSMNFQSKISWKDQTEEIKEKHNN